MQVESRTNAGRPSGLAGAPKRPPKRRRVARNLYERTADRKYEAKFTDPATGRLVSKTLAARTRGEARIELGVLLGQVARGEAAAPSRLSFAAVSEEFLRGLEGQVAAGARAPRTFATYAGHLRARILPALGSRAIQKITTDDLARLIARWQTEGLSASTVRGTLVPLGRVFKLALRRGFIASSPLALLEASERPRSPAKAEQRVLTHLEIAELLRAAVAPYRTLLATAVYSGLRQAELLGLTWQDVDLEGGFLHVRFQLSRATSSAPAQRVPLKSHAGKRSVVLLPQLGRLLREHRLASGYSGPTDYVFASANGSPLHYRSASRGLDRAAKAAGLGRVRSHDLRHGFASHLILDLGVDIVQTSRMLGHASPSITLDTYSHLFDHANHAASIREAMASSAFGRVLDIESECALSARTIGGE